MSKKFTKLLAILLSLNLTFGTGTFAAFAAEAEGSADTGYSESSESAVSDSDAADSSAESTPDAGDSAPAEGTGEAAEPSAPSEPASPSESEAPAEVTPSAPAEEAPADTAPAEEKPAEEKPVAAYAVTTFTQDSIKYDVSTGNAVVTGCADSVTNLVIPETVTYDDKEYTVVGIQDSAFDWVSHRSLALETVDLSGLPLEIGSYAFRGQKSLTTVTGMDNITAVGDHMFTACTSMTSISNLSKVTSVGAQAFMNCSALTSIDGLNFSALTSIGQEAFNKMSSFSLELDEHTFDSLESLGKLAFANTAGITGTVVLPSLKEIPDSAFTSTGVTGVDLTETVSIGKSAFDKCAELTELHLPDSVTTIGSNAFSNTGLTGELVIPDSVTTVGSSAFMNTAISGFTLSRNMTSISSNLFKGCKNLTGTLTLPEGILSIGSVAFGDTNYTELNLPDSLEIIDNSAFIRCASLTTVQIGEKGQKNSHLTHIVKRAFQDCNALTSFVIEASNADVAIDPDYKLGSKVYPTIPSTVTVEFAVNVNGENIREGEETTLQQAVDAVEENGTATITADKSFIVDGTVTIPSGKTITLTDEGKGLSVVFKNGFTGPAFRVEQGAALILDGSFNFSCFRISKGSFAEVNGAMTLSGGTITRMNLSGSSMGVITVNGGSFTMENGEISSISASSADCGAVYVKNGGTFAMNGGKITDCTFKQQYSGVVNLADGTMTMTDGTVSGNTVSNYNAAGGVLVNGDSSLTMSGGTISDNTASCGGGVYSWSGRDRVVLEGGNIVNNTADRQGGGVYVSHAPWSITIKNALITANTATIQGGGIWSCPKGTVSLGTDVAVFGNSAGKSADDAAFLVKYSEDLSTSFTGKMYGGGLVIWYRDTSVILGDANYGAVAGNRYDAANPGAPIEPVSGEIKGYGLKAVVSAEGKALAETAPLKITGNTAERGGGVGTNGEVIIPGEDTPENPVSLTVHKVWSGASEYPTAVTVNLIRIAQDSTRTAIGTVLLSENSTDKDGKTWSYTFTNLDGAYTYTVEEEAVDGFNTSISGSMADGFTITNSKKPSGGGGGGHHKPDPEPTPTPEPKPPVDIPDQPTPLDPLTPTVDIPDDKTPTTEPETPTKTPDKTPTVNIPETKVPTSSVPKTGDIGGLWAALCGLSAMGLAYFGVRRKHD